MNKYGEGLVFPGTLRGYRTWILDPYGYEHSYLRAMGASGYGWEEGINEASCIYGTIDSFKKQDYVEHKTPNSSCSCGFYATHTPELAIDDPICWNPMTVFGVVEATGKILVGKSGFRAEKARIVALSKWLTAPALVNVPYLLQKNLFISRPEIRSYEEALREGTLACQFTRYSDTLGANSFFSAHGYARHIDYGEAMEYLIPSFHVSPFHALIDRLNTSEMLNPGGPVYKCMPSSYRYSIGYFIHELEHNTKSYERQLDRLQEAYEVPVYKSLKKMVDDFPPIPLGDALTAALSGQSS
ncbi:MAG TPA: hypothetical protein VIY48_17485 [Candidatus Paceibacterota bacterium]